ncbi:hypothetical protein DUI87_09069 [Hirundo rustica rustica]|uniref:Uncharacterized protein n=1 Tax=Hirundo rustica rustica TaxID=333673 RepID=A0A3M0KLL5_HIRRU|nr:hypothetical protein DUI87_09069 [Hirundo rustica rustica]
MNIRVRGWAGLSIMFDLSQKHNRHKFRLSTEEFIEINIHAAYLRKNQLRLSTNREDSGINQICTDFEVNRS